MTGEMLPVDYKLEDIDIFDGRGVDMPCLDGTFIHIGQLSPYDWFYVYMPGMMRIMNYFNAIMPGIDIMNIEGNTRQLSEILYTAFITKQFRVYYLALLKKIKVFTCSMRKFEREKVTINQLAEIFALLYKFNTEGFKKKLKFLADLMYQSPKNSGILSTHANQKDGLYRKFRVVEKIEIPQKIKSSS